MPDENVDLVRRIYTAWERGDFSETWWCADDIEFEITDGLPPIRVRGADAMRSAWRDWLQGWESFHTRAEEFRDLGDAVLAINTFGGEGRTSGLQPDARGATVWTIRDGRVTRLALYAGVENAFADLGIEDD